MRTVAAIFVDAEGPYIGMPDVDCWTEQRNAHLYNGPYPVVAHPACGPWGRLYKNCTKQNRDDAVSALSSVRRFGGVLEHPEYSRLWNEYRIPKPGEPLDEFGGFTLGVDQVSYGHRALKPTWLYVVRGLVPKLKFGGIPTHQVVGNRRLSVYGTYLRPLSKLELRITPLPFAQLLVTIARSVA